VVWLSFYNNELYAIGSYYDRTAGKTVPCYWKNNTKENLDDINSVPGYVNVHCGFVYNDQVYAGGSYLVGSQRIPCYWDQNGRHDLAIPEGESAEVTTLFVNSDGVYAGGFLYPWTACYWDEKGELHQLNGKDVKEMKIVNGCIYLGGANESGACYWVIDGEQERIVQLEGIDTEVYSIFVQDDKVYAGGRFNISYTFPRKFTACYWDEDGKQHYFQSEHDESIAEAIFVYDNQVYAAGWFGDVYGYSACYWDSAGRYELDDNGSDLSYGKCIFVR